MVVRIVNGDALAVLRTLESESVQVCVTSPPYFALRDYGVEGQLGLEPTPAAFIAALVEVFDEVKRVLRKDGLVFCNLGDSYAGSGKGPTGSNGIGDQERRQGFTGPVVTDNSSHRGKKTGTFRNGSAYIESGNRGNAVAGIPAKNLLLIPERFAIAMQDAGWVVRSRIAWCKTSAMPESVRDRPTSAWEHIFMFSKNARYFYDAEAVRQPHAASTVSMVASNHNGRAGSAKGRDNPSAKQIATAGRWADMPRVLDPRGASLRNFWLLGPEPSREAHYAAFPTEIPKRCILAGTSQAGACPACGAPWARVVDLSPRDYGMGTADTKGHKAVQINANARVRHRSPTGHTLSKTTSVTLGWAPSCSCQDAGPPVPCVVLDPFLGSGTTALVADRLGRDAIGIDLSPTYCQMAREKIESDEQMFSDPVELVEQAEQLSMLGAL